MLVLVLLLLLVCRSLQKVVVVAVFYFFFFSPKSFSDLVPSFFWGGLCSVWRVVWSSFGALVGVCVGRETHSANRKCHELRGGVCILFLLLPPGAFSHSGRCYVVHTPMYDIHAKTKKQEKKQQRQEAGAAASPFSQRRFSTIVLFRTLN